MVNAASWRHNASQRYVFSGFFDYQVLVNKSPGNAESPCANLARICTLSVISSKSLPSSNLVTQSPNVKRRTRYLQHNDGRVLCKGDWALVSEVFDMFLIFHPLERSFHYQTSYSAFAYRLLFKMRRFFQQQPPSNKRTRVATIVNWTHALRSPTPATLSTYA